MNIKSAKYIASWRTGDNDSVTVTQQDDSLLSIPMAADNTDYQEILEWAKIDGNSIEDADQRYFPFYKY